MDLTIAEFVFLILFSSCVLVLGCSVISRRLHANAEKRSIARRIVCRLCLHAFENTGSGQIVDCPQCGAANERGRSRKLG